MKKYQWFEEKVLQRYLKESYQDYQSWFETEYSEKIIGVEYNPKGLDRYPDLYGILKSGKRIPIEVEWATNKFDHDASVIEDGDGCIAVLENNIPLFPLKQLVLDREKFKKWFVKNSAEIHDETVDSRVSKKGYTKRPPKLWFYYNTESEMTNRPQTLKAKTFGVPFVFRQLERFKDIRKNDLICFVGPFKGYGETGGRVPLDVFLKNKKMICNEMTLYKITSDCYYSESKIWDYETKAISPEKIKNYPHRFKFDTNEIANIGDIKISSLTLPSKTAMHKLPYTIFWEGKPDILVDLSSMGKLNKRK